ncbi:hypothetical protein ACS0TY_014549 [Phlomoides rotata]
MCLKQGAVDLFHSLAKRPSITFDELLERAEKYINLEEINKIKMGEEKTPSSKKESEKKRELLKEAEIKKGSSFLKDLKNTSRYPWSQQSY